MDEFHPMIYLIQLINEIHPCKMIFTHMKSFIYGHIHPCMWIKIILSFKLQTQALGSSTSHPCHQLGDKLCK